MSKHFHNIFFTIYFGNPFFEYCKILINIDLFLDMSYEPKYCKLYSSIFNKVRSRNQTIFNVLCPIFYDLILIG